MRKLWALSVIALMAAFHYVMANWPVPVDVSATTVEARAGDEIVLIGPRLTEPVSVYMGRFGETLDIRFDRARLADNTAALFESLKLHPPLDEQPIGWLMQNAQGTKAHLKLELTPTLAHSQASLHMFKLSNGNPAPNFSIRFTNATARISVVAPLGESGEDPNPQRVLRVGSEVYQIPGALPISLELPAGGTVELAFSSATSPWSSKGYFDAFQFAPVQEAPGGPPSVPALAVGVHGQGEDGHYLLYLACRAAGEILRSTRAAALDVTRCQERDAGSLLQIGTFKVWPDRLELGLAGTGWVARHGHLDVKDIESRLKENPTILALLAALDSALLAWAWKVWTRRS